MKFSVVTASFNQGRFVRKCLASVREQEGDFSLEHIVLDNCSTDSTVSALAEAAACPGRVDLRIFVEPDGGQTAAINKGFSLATGDVVCWLNTDEWYAPGALAAVAAFFEANPEVDVVFGDCDFVDSDGVLLKRKKEFFFSHSMLIFYGCFLPSCATFVRRRVIDEGILLDPEFRVTMDFDWYVRIARAGHRIAHISRVLASFTWHDTNISSVQVLRRLQERRLVQDRYSGVRGATWVRTMVFEGMKYFWIALRVMRRRIG